MLRSCRCNRAVFRSLCRVPTASKLNSTVEKYERVTGLSELKSLQDAVIKTEKTFIDAQQLRRRTQTELHGIQAKVKDVQAELNKLTRGDQRYLEKLTQEHQLFRDESDLLASLQQHEQNERDLFTRFSSTVRDAHEKERLRTERMKYWGYVFGAFGALLGMTGTLISSHYRNRNLNLVLERSETEFPVALQEILSAISGQAGTLSQIAKALKVYSSETADEQALAVGQFNDGDTAIQDQSIRRILGLLAQQQPVLEKIVKVLERHNFNAATCVKVHRDEPTPTEAADEPPSGEDVVNIQLVCGESRVQEMLDNCEQNLERQVKLQALATVVLVYAAFAVVVPLVYYAMGGS